MRTESRIATVATRSRAVSSSRRTWFARSLRSPSELSQHFLASRAPPRPSSTSRSLDISQEVAIARLRFPGVVLRTRQWVDRRPSSILSSFRRRSPSPSVVRKAPYTAYTAHACAAAVARATANQMRKYAHDRAIGSSLAALVSNQPPVVPPPF